MLALSVLGQDTQVPASTGLLPEGGEQRVGPGGPESWELPSPSPHLPGFLAMSPLGALAPSYLQLN